MLYNVIATPCIYILHQGSLSARPLIGLSYGGAFWARYLPGGKPCVTSCPLKDQIARISIALNFNHHLVSSPTDPEA